jgi:hypothetical protein
MKQMFGSSLTGVETSKVFSSIVFGTNLCPLGSIVFVIKLAGLKSNFDFRLLVFL